MQRNSIRTGEGQQDMNFTEMCQNTLQFIEEKRSLKLKKTTLKMRHTSVFIDSEQHKAKCNKVRKETRAKPRAVISWLEDHCKDIRRYHGD